MKIYIALIRGINVGGKGILSMKSLVSLLKEIGCSDVRTYIQSGNAVFRSTEAGAAALANRIRMAIKKKHGFDPAVHVLGANELEEIVASNPFPEAESEPRKLNVYFLESTPKNPDLEAMERIRAGNERFVVAGKVFYLHAPDGIGKSKLASSVERLLRVSMTSRNWRTVRKITEMAREYK